MNVKIHTTEEIQQIARQVAEALIRETADALSQQSSQQRCYTRREAAAMLGVSVRTLDEWCRAGLIKRRRHPTGKPFFLQSDIEALIGKK